VPTPDEIKALLIGKSPEELQGMIDSSRKQLKTIAKKEEAKNREEIEAELDPLEESLKTAEAGYIKVKEAFEAQLKKIRDQRDTHLEKAKERVVAARNSLNNKRKNLGLKATRKTSAGPQMQWFLEIKHVGKNAKAIVGIKNKPDSNIEIEITSEGKVNANELRDNLFKKNGIEDIGEGKMRGLQTRIKLAYLGSLEEPHMKETIKNM